MQQEPEYFKREWNNLSSRLALIRAVILTSDDLKAANKEVGSDDLTTFRSMFCREVLPHIKKKWASLTDSDPDMFPWSLDFLIYTWMSWRKAMKDAIPRFRHNCGL